MNCPFCNERTTMRADGFEFCSDYMTCAGRVNDEGKWVTTCEHCLEIIGPAEIGLRESLCFVCAVKSR